jgi:signal transduction histidine kinase
MSARPDITLNIEYLNSKNDSAFYKDQLCIDVFSRKYRPENIDLIITSDNDALDFVNINHQLPLFEGKPVVACGISDPENYSTMKNLVVVKEITSFNETFRLMKHFTPALDTIYFISDGLKSSSIFMKETRQIMDEHFPDIVLSFIDCIDPTTLGSQISTIDFPSSIFYSSVSLSCKGEPLNELEIANLVSANAKVPLYSGYYTTVTDGFIGGCMTTGHQMGVLCSETALQILEANNRIPKERVITPEAMTVFDYRKLQQFSIPPEIIPANSIILHKPISVWVKNKKVIVIAGLIILQLLIVIGFMYRAIFLQKRYREQIMLAMRKANESDMLKSIFLENVSHEMRTPLNSIVGFSDILLELEENKKTLEYVKIISDNALLLNHTISHVFDFSLLKTHNVDINPSEVPLTELLSLIIETIHNERRFVGKPIEVFIENDVSNPELTIETDENKIFSVLKHITDNAFKFTSSGEIRIGYQLFNTKEQLTTQKLKHPLSLPFVLFYIADTGQGISDEYCDLIFEPFRQVKETNVDANRGLGLGLSISKSIIEMLGGSIWIESPPAGGSTFYFTHPLRIEEKKWK